MQSYGFTNIPQWGGVCEVINHNICLPGQLPLYTFQKRSYLAPGTPHGFFEMINGFETDLNLFSSISFD